ncbi:MAG: porin family protein [Prevotella sp.]|nr:porin family protein [Prevotella sp.]
MKTYVIGILTFLLPLTVMAQEEDQYKMEIGVAAGVVSYEGDFNGSILKDMQPMASILWRNIFNPYMGLKLDLSYGKLKGSSNDAETYYPDYDEPERGANPYEFSNTLIDLSLTYEYNFWPYGTGKDYRGAKRLTPFVFLGLGATFVTGGGQNTFTMNVPIGLGVKYKIGSRLNLGLEWAMHFSLSDKLDGVKDPYRIQSSGIFKNTDCYSMLRLTLTYSFMRKCSVCNKDD